MSDHGPLEGGSPFDGIPFLGDIMRMLQGQGSMGWDAARQLAVALASEGQSEPNVDPMDRIRLEELSRVAELHVEQATGLPTARSGRSPIVRPATRAEWATKAFDDLRPLLSTLASHLVAEPPAGDLPDDQEQALLAQMMRLISPVMTSMTTGSMIGHLASRSLATYDLPIPRPGHEILLVRRNVHSFADEWSIDRDALDMWLCLHEIAHHTVLGVPHVHERMTELLSTHAAAFRPDPERLQQQIGEIDITDPSGFGALQSALSDPQALLGAVKTDEQRHLDSAISALVAVIVGYVDHLLDKLGSRLVPEYPRLTEALRRRRVESSPADRFTEGMLGLDLTTAQCERGQRFIAGVVEREGEDSLTRLWESPATLPTPAELDAPGLWLARLELLEPGD